uniref:Uncharacterized protein n=1 Tax=Rhizophora mucronata TaxID=61149 RepID=A0A2P2PAH3_RHIMU
MMIMTIAWG